MNSDVLASIWFPLNVRLTMESRSQTNEIPQGSGRLASSSHILWWKKTPGTSHDSRVCHMAGQEEVWKWGGRFLFPAGGALTCNQRNQPTNQRNKPTNETNQPTNETNQPTKPIQPNPTQPKQHIDYLIVVAWIFGPSCTGPVGMATSIQTHHNWASLLTKGWACWINSFQKRT